MPRKFNKDIYDVVEALLAADVPVAEIMRRLNEGEAGLDHKVAIKLRTVYDYRTRIREDELSEDVDHDAAAHSIAAIKKRSIERVAKEIAYLEKIPAGKITSEQATTLRRLFSTLDDMERRERQMQKSRPASTLSPNGDDRPESAVERLARNRREGK